MSGERLQDHWSSSYKWSVWEAKDFTLIRLTLQPCIIGQIFICTAQTLYLSYGNSFRSAFWSDAHFTIRMWPRHSVMFIYLHNCILHISVAQFQLDLFKDKYTANNFLCSFGSCIIYANYKIYLFSFQKKKICSKANVYEVFNNTNWLKWKIWNMKIDMFFGKFRTTSCVYMLFQPWKGLLCQQIILLETITYLF